MIKGIGIDIIDITRIVALTKRKPQFVEKILAPEEIEQFNQLGEGKRRNEWLAGRFAAKEAFSKALGTGIGAEAPFHEIVVVNDEVGKPVVHFRALKGVHLSISHSERYAVAQVVIEE